LTQCDVSRTRALL